MQKFLKSLCFHLENQQIHYYDADVHSILEFMWYCYTESNPIHTQDIQQHFDALEPIIKSLSFDDGTELFNTVCSLCVEYEKQAFLEGLHVGAHLHKELYENKESQ